MSWQLLLTEILKVAGKAAAIAAVNTTAEMLKAKNENQNEIEKQAEVPKLEVIGGKVYIK